MRVIQRSHGAGFKDLAHASGADGREDFVGAKFVAGGERHCVWYGVS